MKMRKIGAVMSLEGSIIIGTFILLYSSLLLFAFFLHDRSMIESNLYRKGISTLYKVEGGHRIGGYYLFFKNVEWKLEEGRDILKDKVRVGANSTSQIKGIVPIRFSIQREILLESYRPSDLLWQRKGATKIIDKSR